VARCCLPVMPQATLAALLLYYITDRSQFSGDEAARGAALLDRITAAADAGVDYIQLREKDLPGRALESLARAAAERIRVAGTHTRLLINSRMDVAIAVGADGVHLPAADLTVSDARRVSAAAGVPGKLIAVSCHMQAEVLRAKKDGADFAVLGPIFEKSKFEGMVSAGIGLERLREMVASAPSLPLLALGGVTIENAEACLRMGAAGVAGIRLFQHRDLAATVSRLRASGPRL
jgi:thiamine-phosphate pyrophosphorylase